MLGGNKFTYIYIYIYVCVREVAHIIVILLNNLFQNSSNTLEVYNWLQL